MKTHIQLQSYRVSNVDTEIPEIFSISSNRKSR